MGNVLRRVCILFLSLALIAACSRRRPVDYGTGEFVCDTCGMTIVDMRYKAEIITLKGKIRHFDSIECLEKWSQRYPQEVRSRWVTDFYHPKQWIPLEKALMLRSEKISSPMQGHLAAFPNHDAFMQGQQQFGGELVIP